MRTSNSAIQCFKSCRRLYELKYKYGLEPVQTADTLKRGLSYHDGIERFFRHEDVEIDSPKIRAMVNAFEDHVLQELYEKGIEVKDVEQWFDYTTESGHTVVGRVDGITSDGSVIEHKSTSGLIDGAYFQRLDFDEQIPTYMLACKTNNVYYTVCATPTIRQRNNESETAYIERCAEWYKDMPDSKITVIELYRPQEALETFADEQDAIITEMEGCKLFYRNPNHCMKWGRLCEYAPICMNYDPDREYIQFKRREQR